MRFTPDSKTNLMKDEIKFLNGGHFETNKGDIGWMRAVRAI